MGGKAKKKGKKKRTDGDGDSDELTERESGSVDDVYASLPGRQSVSSTSKKYK